MNGPHEPSPYELATRIADIRLDLVNKVDKEVYAANHRAMEDRMKDVEAWQDNTDQRSRQLMMMMLVTVVASVLSLVVGIAVAVATGVGS